MPRRSVIRASDVERDAVADRLRHAAAEGRILASELEHRLGLALRASTIGELDGLVADLPGKRGQRAPSRSPGNLPTVRTAVTVAVVTVAVLAVLAVAALVLVGLFAAWAMWAILAWWAFGHRHGRRGPQGRSGRPSLRSARRGLL